MNQGIAVRPAECYRWVMASTPLVQLVTSFKLLRTSLAHPGRALEINVDSGGHVNVVPEPEAQEADATPGGQP